MLSPMPETRFDEWIAQRYETLWPELFDPAVLDPAVAFLVDLAGAGPALEFGVGTGRVAVPLSSRGVRVHGIELSPAMVAQLRATPGGAGVEVTTGDYATTGVAGRFALVYLLRNTITNLTTQDEQVAAFRNAAAHLEPGGHFVIENYVPELRRLPPGDTVRVFTATKPTSRTRTTTSPGRWRSHTTTGSSTGGWRRSRRRTAMCGPPSSTSWLAWPA
jgi:SAM-dependent methyltransferase